MKCTPEGEHCAGFNQLVEVGGIYDHSGQMLLKSGEIIDIFYYWIGPKNKPGKGMMAQFCPCCGGEIAETAKFLADMEARHKEEESA